MPSLPEMIPDVDYLLSLEPEELASYLLVAAATQRQSGLIAMANFISGLTSTHSHPASYSDPRRDDIALAITEAWNWLEVQGLLIPVPGMNGSNGFRVLSRRAAKMAQPADVSQFARSRRIPKDALHPKIAEKVWSAFMRGEYDAAVFQAMKIVEVSVREAAGFTAGDLGTDLMRKAFHEDNGPLTDKSAEKSERQARSALFSGAIGSLQKPTLSQGRQS
ncbi:TIGR02391 family protein [Tardiphaga sp.]|uniref:TIGR02391 family protein n=1 Tax=Tardiphaga sp. TaxID=1926292 RepID=UPI00352AFAC3